MRQLLFVLLTSFSMAVYANNIPATASCYFSDNNTKYYDGEFVNSSAGYYTIYARGNYHLLPISHCIIDYK